MAPNKTLQKSAVPSLALAAFLLWGCTAANHHPPAPPPTPSAAAAAPNQTISQPPPPALQSTELKQATDAAQQVVQSLNDATARATALIQDQQSITDAAASARTAISAAQASQQASAARLENAVQTANAMQARIAATEQSKTNTVPPTPKRKALADYVPCRFIATDETDLLRGRTDAPSAAATPPATAPTSATGLAVASLDIGCSQSILTWSEANSIFGRAIANTYIVIQVTTRNLNGDQEFLLHDVQVAVNPVNLNGVAGPSHFVAGRDKVLARGVAVVGQSNTSRNVWERVFEAVGSVLGSASLVTGGPSFKDALQVFTTAAIPGFKSLFPDNTIQQLSRLDDFGFSSASAYKIVIPKSGSVPFVTFLPANVFSRNYKMFTSEQLFQLQKNTYVVIAGKHITEVASDTVEVTKLDCPTSEGYLDLSKASGDNLSCTITGQNLQKLAAVRLENASESNDKVTADGTVTISGQTTTGTVVFSVKKLQTLKAPAYLVYIPDPTGDVATTIQYKLPPVLLGTNLNGKLSVGGASCSATQPCTFNVKGNNLQLVAKFVLKSQDTEATPVATGTVGAVAADGSLPVTFKFADLPTPSADTTYRLQALTSDGSAILPSIPIVLGQ